MKNLLSSLALASVLALGSGCIFSISGTDEELGHHHGSRSKPAPAPAPAPVVIMPANTDDAAVLAEIDAAGKLTFDDGKVTALGNVASRPALSPAAQVHLVNTLLNRLSFDDGKIRVLRVLIANPAFSPAAKETIFRRLESLEFDGSRVSVMNAIQERSAKP